MSSVSGQTNSSRSSTSGRYRPASRSKGIQPCQPQMIFAFFPSSIPFSLTPTDWMGMTPAIGRFGSAPRYRSTGSAGRVQRPSALPRGLCPRRQAGSDTVLPGRSGGQRHPPGKATGCGSPARGRCPALAVQTPPSSARCLALRLGTNPAVAGRFPSARRRGG